MTPEQFEIFLERNEKSTADAVRKTVNGKIDHIKELMEGHNQRHEADMVEVKKHIEKVTPIIEAYSGFNSAGNLVKWVAGVGTAVGVLWMMLKSLAK